MEVLEILNVIIFYTIFMIYVVCIAHMVSTVKRLL